MTLFAVEVTYTLDTTVYVEADSHDEAIEAAEELAADYIREEYPFVDSYATPIDTAPENNDVWVGGADGSFVAAEEWNKRNA